MLTEVAAQAAVQAAHTKALATARQASGASNAQKASYHHLQAAATKAQGTAAAQAAHAAAAARARKAQPVAEEGGEEEEALPVADALALPAAPTAALAAVPLAWLPPLPMSSPLAVSPVAEPLFAASLYGLLSSAAQSATDVARAAANDMRSAAFEHSAEAADCQQHAAHTSVEVSAAAASADASAQAAARAELGSQSVRPAVLHRQPSSKPKLRFSTLPSDASGASGCLDRFAGLAAGSGGPRGDSAGRSSTSVGRTALIDGEPHELPEAPPYVPMTAGSRYEKKDKPKPNSLPCIILCVFRLLVRAVSVLVLGRLPLLL